MLFSAEVSGGVVPHRSQNCSYGGPARMRSCPGNRALVRERLHTPNGSPSRVFAAPPRRFVASCFSALAGASLPRLPLSVAQVRGSPRLSGRVAQRGRIGGAVRSRGPAVAGRLRARRGSFGRRRRGRGPACIEVVQYGCHRAALARPPSLRPPGRRGPGLRVVQGGFFAPGGCVAGLASGACHPGVAPPPGVPAGRRQPVWCARWDPRRGQVQCGLALRGRGPVGRTEDRNTRALLQATQCRKKPVASWLS